MRTPGGELEMRCGMKNPTPRRCRLFSTSLEVLDVITRSHRHLDLPSDAKLVGVEKSPLDGSITGLLYASETFDFIPPGKPWPLLVPFVRKVAE